MDPKSEKSSAEKVISVGVEEELLDAAAIDSIIEEADPQFAAELKSIQADKNLQLTEVALSDAEQALAEERELWTAKTGLRKTAVRFLPFLPRVSLFVKKLKFGFYKLLRNLWIRTKNFRYFLATEGRTQLIGKAKEMKTSSVESLKTSVSEFKGLPGRLKLFAFGVLLFFGLVVAAIYYLYSFQLFQGKKEMFLSSFESVADEEIKEISGATENFYDNLRSSANLILLPKMIVNLRPSPPFHRNPMGAFEFYIEGMAPEVVVNIKMNESYVRDYIQRKLESYSFSELDSEAGKRELVETLRKELNQRIEGGGVKSVLIKNIVFKP
jgi:flagellar basal body-associated protein FliL